jgi:molybdopterin-guanine dinucleotide biosynthesis protein A
MQAALILAGGRGTRLTGGAGQTTAGVDKAFLLLAGKPLIAHVLERLLAQMPQKSAPPKIAISANGDPNRFAPYALPVLPDGPHAGAGPLAGIIAGLIWAQSIGATALLTLPVDTPFFPNDFLARLTPAPAVAVHQTRQHHLAANWPTTALPLLETFLTSAHPKRVRDAHTRLKTRQIPFESETDPFHNINTPEDLAAAEKLMQARGTNKPSWRAPAKQPRL